MPRLSGAGELVGFARKLHHYGRHFAELEGAEHFLPTRPPGGVRVSLSPSTNIIGVFTFLI